MNETSHYSNSRLRRSIVHFGFGRIANGALGFAILLLISGGLAPAEFGAYVVLGALIFLSIDLSMLGLDVIGSVYLPQYRVNASPSRLASFIARLLAFRLLTLLVCIVGLYLAMTPLVHFFHIEAWRDSALLCLLVVLFMGTATFFQHVIFVPLLLQGASQMNWLVRNVALAGLLVLLLATHEGRLSLAEVIEAEIFASAISVAVGFLQLGMYWRNQGVEDTTDDDWQAPTLRKLIRLGGFQFIGALLYHLGGPQPILLMAGRFLGPGAMAGFGFSMMLTGRLQAYLPAKIFWPLFQPKLVVAYTAKRDFSEVNRGASLLYKASLCILAPVFSIFIVYGEGALSLLSQGKYGDAAPVAAALVLTLIPLSHKTVLWGVAVTVERADVVARASVAALCTLPLAVLFFSLGFGTLGLVAAILIGTLVFNMQAIRGLRQAGFDYRLDLRGISKIGLATAATVLCLALVVEQSPSLPAAIAIVSAAIGLFLVFSFFLKPFTESERAAINRLLKRKAFVW